MSIGAERADAQPFNGTSEPEEQAWGGLPEDDIVYQEEAAEASGERKFLAAFLILLALGWTGASGWVVAETVPGMAPAAVLSWVATVSVPLVLLGLIWLLFGRSSRRETERFTAAVAAMRTESAALENMLAIVAARLGENQAKLGEEAARLMALGDEASDRLGRVTHYLARETAELARKSQALESAAANARVDIGVLLHDLPRAEEQALSLGTAMRETGLAAHEQADELAGRLSSLIARGREADDVVGSAAQRLGANLSRIESASSSASERIEQATAGMNSSLGGALALASESTDAIRAALDEQGRTMLAMIEQSRASFAEAGDAAARGLAERLDRVGARLDGLTGKLAAEDEVSRKLVQRLSQDLDDLDKGLRTLAETGGKTRESLVESVAAVGERVCELQSEFDGSGSRAEELIGRAREMGEALSSVTAQLQSELPEALAKVEAQAGRTGEAARSAVPSVEAIQAAAALAAQSVADSEGSIARQQAAADALLATLDGGVQAAEAQLESLATAIGSADGIAARLVADTAPGLIDSLLRVREAAAQAANHAREAIAQVIPESAGRLAEASRDALSEAVTEPVAEQLAQLQLMSEGAVAAARKASERLTRQLLTIGESAAAMEARFDEERRGREEKDGETLSRRVALLIESLNSTAIDVTKILSNEVTDSAWAAYLKGDRGIFTRRAVRLLDHNDARELLRHYEEEPEFREQVNRYIHDFEALLARVLAGREGTPLGITLLSSDMGKLYVALAQAIERLRK
jgi:hypothetical protein